VTMARKTGLPKIMRMLCVIKFVMLSSIYASVVSFPFASAVDAHTSSASDAPKMDDETGFSPSPANASPTHSICALMSEARDIKGYLHQSEVITYCANDCTFIPKMICIDLSTFEPVNFFGLDTVWNYTSFYDFVQKHKNVTHEPLIDMRLSSESIRLLLWNMFPYALIVFPLYADSNSWRPFGRFFLGLAHVLIVVSLCDTTTAFSVLMLNLTLLFSKAGLKINSALGYFLAILGVQMVSLMSRSAFVMVLCFMCVLSAGCLHTFRELVDKRQSDTINLLFRVWFLYVIFELNNKMMTSFGHDSLLISLLNLTIAACSGTGSHGGFIWNTLMAGLDLRIDGIFTEPINEFYAQSMGSVYHLFVWAGFRSLIGVSAIKNQHQIGYKTLGHGLYLYFVSGSSSFLYFSTFLDARKRRGANALIYHLMITYLMWCELRYDTEAFFLRIGLEIYEQFWGKTGVTDVLKALSFEFTGALTELAVFKQNGNKGFADMSTLMKLREAIVTITTTNSEGKRSSGVGLLVRIENNKRLLTVRHVISDSIRLTINHYDGSQQEINDPRSFKLIQHRRYSDAAVVVAFESHTCEHHFFDSLKQRDIPKVNQMMVVTGDSKFSQTDRFSFNDDVITLGMTLVHGNSGGPCFAMVLGKDNKLHLKIAGVVSAGNADEDGGNIVACVDHYKDKSTNDGLGPKAIYSKSIDRSRGDSEIIDQRNQIIAGASIKRSEMISLESDLALFIAKLEGLDKPKAYRARGNSPPRTNNGKRRKSNQKDAAAKKRAMQLNIYDLKMAIMACKLAIDQSRNRIIAHMNNPASPTVADHDLMRAFELGHQIEMKRSVKFNDNDRYETGSASSGTYDSGNGFSSDENDENDEPCASEHTPRMQGYMHTDISPDSPDNERDQDT